MAAVASVTRPPTATATATATTATAIATPSPALISLPSSFILRRRRQNPNLIMQRILSHSHKKRPSTVAGVSTSAAESGVGNSDLVLEVREMKERSKKWLWKDQYSINYFVQAPAQAAAQRPPLVLVHGFGASIPHWRRNIMTLAQDYKVYAIDLLGFGASEKPAGFMYTMEKWSELILDFLKEVVQEPAVLIGNSVDTSRSVHLVRGLVLLNCAGGMNNKAIVDDWRIKLVLPLLWLIDFLLQRKTIASSIFERVKQRDNLRNILSSVYANKESVDDTLVDIIKEPADDEGALDAFVSIVTGPPGPSPIQLLPRISIPILVLWGDQDPFTPLDGPVGKYFTSIAGSQQNLELFVLEGVGHCPHDDRPESVHERLLPWLANLSSA